MKNVFIAVSCVVLFISFTDVFAQDATLEFPTGTMTLTSLEEDPRSPTLSPVVFPHSLHFSFSCKDCHHNWDGVSSVQSCSASGCHEKMWAPLPGTVPLDSRQVKSLTGAYHQACRTCHRQVEQEQKAAGRRQVSTGPIACEGCHPNPHSEVENSEESMTIPLGNLTIAPPESVDAKRGAVDFPHGLHFQFPCQSCHHDWDGESEVEGCMASGCHDETEPSGKRDIKDPDNVLYYLAAYHNMCVGCHKDLENERQAQDMTMAAHGNQGRPVKVEPIKTGPLGCKGCHS